jgi:hypothetical protein
MTTHPQKKKPTKQQKRLAARINNEFYWNGKLVQYGFGMIPDFNGKPTMYVKPGSQNRKK